MIPWFGAVLVFLALVILRKVYLMSQSLVNLKAAADSAVAEIVTLRDQVSSLSAQVATLEAAQGTPDAALDVVTAELTAAVSPAPPPELAPPTA